MKKIISLILAALLALSMTFAASAETLVMEDFTMEIPEIFENVFPNSEILTSVFYMKDNAVDLSIMQLDSPITSSIDECIAEFGFNKAKGKVGYEMIDVNGTQMALMNFEHENEKNRAVFFIAGTHYYDISLEENRPLNDEEIEMFNNMIHSIVMTTDQSIAPSSVREPGSTEQEPASVEQESSSEETPKNEAQEYETLEKGSKGEEVRNLQQRLVDLNWLDGGVDGDYGNKTKAAIERFQESAGLDVTGIADSTTQVMLYSENAPRG